MAARAAFANALSGRPVTGLSEQNYTGIVGLDQGDVSQLCVPFNNVSVSTAGSDVARFFL